MRYIKIVSIFLLFFTKSSAQELLAEVVLNHQQLQSSSSNMQEFDKMKSQITSFLNTTRFTNKTFRPEDRVKVTYIINLQSKPGQNDFSATLQVQSSRLIKDSQYYSPLINLNDSDFSFRFFPYSSLRLNKNQFDRNNITSVLAYYAYIVLGFHADSYIQNGGDEYFKIAENMVSQAQGVSYSGWDDRNAETRAGLSNTLRDESFKPLRKLMYTYHKAMDGMHANLIQEKENLYTELLKLNELNLRATNNYFLRVFFNSKSDEIVEVFSGGPKIDKDMKELKNTLEKIFPTYLSKWNKIKR